MCGWVLATSLARQKHFISLDVPAKNLFQEVISKFSRKIFNFFGSRETSNKTSINKDLHHRFALVVF